MRKIVLLLLLSFGVAFGLSAQTVVRGKIANIPTNALKVAMVEFWSVDHWQQLAILQLEAEGAFSAKVSAPAQAQCRIRMASQNKSWCDFVITPGPKADSVLVFDLDNQTMNGGPAKVSGSAENDLYFTLMTAYQHLSRLQDSTMKTPPAQVQEAVRNFNKLCKEMTQLHPGTYTGDIVANLLYQPSKEDYPKDPKIAAMSANAFVIEHALEKIPFRYDKVLYHNAFAKALNRYYNFFDIASAEGSKTCIDGIMARRAGSEAVDIFVFKYLLVKLMDEKMEAGMHHLLTWYLPDCSDESPLPDNTRTMIKALQNCEPGKAIPDLQMPGPDGANISLSSVYTKNKMTLLFFWRTNCSHCKEFKPVLTDIYERYHAQGLEVLAFSLDKTDTGWLETLRQEPTKWVNVYVPNDRRLELNQQFPIPSTPTLISIDDKGRVLSRLILRDQLESYLKENLPKLGN